MGTLNAKLNPRNKNLYIKHSLLNCSPMYLYIVNYKDIHYAIIEFYTINAHAMKGAVLGRTQN